MGVRVYHGPDSKKDYENAESWYVDSDGNVQIYQPGPDSPETTIAEWASGQWVHVELFPMPAKYQEEEEVNEQ